MKRSNFLAALSAFLLAPFGLKALQKPVGANPSYPVGLANFPETEYTVFKHIPEDEGDWWFSCWCEALDERRLVYIDYPCINGPHNFIIPKDGRQHHITIKYDRSKNMYEGFIDGVLTDTQIDLNVLFNSLPI